MTVTAGHVLNTHMDMIEWYRRPRQEMNSANRIFGLLDGLVLRMLANARTYQVTTPMIYLAKHLRARQEDPVLGQLDGAEFPYRNGFLWLDDPLKIEIADFRVGMQGQLAIRTDDDDGDKNPVEVLAISWLKTEAFSTTEGTSVAREAIPKDLASLPEQVRRAFEPLGGRREWHTAAWVIFWMEPPDGLHREVFGPLFPCGWLVFPGYRARVRHADHEVISLLRALWALMDMELAVSERHEPNRQTRKYAARLQVTPDMRVITLRRTHKAGEATGEHRDIDWSCQWLVRPHRRQLPNGKSTWVRAYIKGPEDKPLRLNEVADAVLWKLRR